MADWVWPEDQGTNSGITEVGQGDDNDAANHASAYYNQNDTDYVVNGLTVTHDSTNDVIDITEGKAKVSDTGAVASHSGETRRLVTYIAEPDARTGLAVTAGSLNHVFLNLLLDGDDSLEYVINTTGDAPSDPSLKIAEVDA